MVISTRAPTAWRPIVTVFTWCTIRPTPTLLQQHRTNGSMGSQKHIKVGQHSNHLNSIRKFNKSQISGDIFDIASPFGNFRLNGCHSGEHPVRHQAPPPTPTTTTTKIRAESINEHLFCLTIKVNPIMDC